MENKTYAQDSSSVLNTKDKEVLDPAAIFRNARLAYNGQMVVAAEMREETLVHGQHFIGVGEYMEKIDNAQRYLRMEMNYSCDNVLYGIKIMADGGKIWISKNKGSEKELKRVNGFKVNAQTANPELVASIDGIPITPISIAGIPYILFQIEKNFKFSSCSIVQDKQTKTLYYVISGTWNPERFPIQDFVSNNEINWKDVPSEIPDSVKVYFGINDLFPHRIYYHRNVKGNQILISKLIFYNISFDVRLNLKQFSYSPSGKISSVDITQDYMTEEAIRKQNENHDEQQNNDPFFF